MLCFTPHTLSYLNQPQHLVSFVIFLGYDVQPVRVRRLHAPRGVDRFRDLRAPLPAPQPGLSFKSVIPPRRPGGKNI